MMADSLRFSNGFFDGQELNIVRSIIDGYAPRALDFDTSVNENYDFMNLLGDGSFIAPMSLMRLVDIKEL